MLLLEPLTQRDKAPAQGKEEQPDPDIHDVHTPSSYAGVALARPSTRFAFATVISKITKGM